MISFLRLWKSLTNNVNEIAGYDSRYKNASEIKVDALPLNISQLNNKLQIDEMNIADDDIIIVELIKN